jgi:hypothetical protein
MRFQFLMVPALLAASPAAFADEYMTLAQAQQAIFPGASFTSADLTLSGEQVDQLSQRTQVTVFHSKVKAWKVSTGGWFFLDQVLGRDDRITYAIGLDSTGAVKGIEVLVCASGYDGVRSQDWLRQFYGSRSETISDPATEIRNYSGATLSSGHITEGVKRVLTTYALFIARKSD